MRINQQVFEDTIAVLIITLLIILVVSGISVMSKDLPAPTQCSCGIQLDPIEPVVKEKQLEAV